MAFEWPGPDWWQRVAPGTARDSLEVMGLAYSLGAAPAERIFGFIREWNFSPENLSPRAFGAYPISAAGVEGFLRSADALVPPADAAIRMTERLVVLEATQNETALALNILDVWRHHHDLTFAEPGHASHCSCLMACTHMPPAVRALDEAVQSYYEQHHELDPPDCFGANDESFRQSLRPLIRRCANRASS